MNLLLIDSRIPDIDIIWNSITENTHCIIFDYTTDTLDTIKTQIQHVYINVGIIQHNYNTPSFKLLDVTNEGMLENIQINDPTLNTWTEYIDFFTWVITNGTQHIDLFACNLWSDPNWRYVIETIRNIHNIHIRASINITGKGGDFILESDNVDTIGLYFLPEILNYKYVFYYGTLETSPEQNYVYSNNYVFPFPSTNLGTLKPSNYATTFGTYTTPPFIEKTNIKQVITNGGQSTAILFNNGTVYTYGTVSNNWGANSSTVSGELINITKIVAGEYSFAALRNDGKVFFWGTYELNIDENTLNNNYIIKYSSVQGQLINIVDIYSSNSSYFARDSNGKIIAWGYMNGLPTVGANVINIFLSDSTVNSYISSGVLSVYTNLISVCFQKQTSILVVYVLKQNNINDNYKFIQYNVPSNYTINDVLICNNNYDPNETVRRVQFIPIIKSGTQLYVVDYIFNSLTFLCNNDIFIVKKSITIVPYVYIDIVGDYAINPNKSVGCLLSNNDLVIVDYTIKPINAGDNAEQLQIKRLLNVTDFTIDGIIVQNGIVQDTFQITDYATLAPTTLYSGNVVVRLFYTKNSKGFLFNNGSFLYSGSIANFTPTAQITNSMASGVINVYDTADGYILIKNDGFVWLGNPNVHIFGFSQYTKTAGSILNYGSFQTGKNLYFLSTNAGILPIELNIQSSSLAQLDVINQTLIINNGDPNRMAHYGRTYKLYGNTASTSSTLLSTFISTSETMTFTFRNISTSVFGQYTLSIIDETNSASTIIEPFNTTLTRYNEIYSYTPIRLSFNNTFDFTYTPYFSLTPGTYYLKTSTSQTIASITVNEGDNPTSLIFNQASTIFATLGTNTLFIYKNDSLISFPMVINVTCFLEGTNILVMDIRKNKTRYIPIEKLKPRMLVKTVSSGLVPIKYIGYSTIYNPGLKTRVRDQLFKCSKSNYPELIEDLVLTGNHSILVETITPKQHDDIINTLGRICVTERKYRLPAFHDTRAVPYEFEGEFRIWNLALDNDNYYENYGIYANGLLVETTSCRYLKELSGMTLVTE